MKKSFISLIILLAVPFILSAQNSKFGHISPEEVMEMMPGFDSIRNVLTDYQNELQSEGEEMMKEFQLKQKDYESKAATYSAAVRKVKEDELRALASRIQDFSSIIEEQFETRKYELLLPLEEQIMKAIKEVADEGKFTYIFRKTYLAYSAQGEDVTELVKKKLGIEK